MAKEEIERYHSYVKQINFTLQDWLSNKNLAQKLLGEKESKISESEAMAGYHKWYIISPNHLKIYHILDHGNEIRVWCYEEELNLDKLDSDIKYDGKSAWGRHDFYVYSIESLKKLLAIFY